MAETFKVGANARELLRYTQRATRIVTDDISRSDARKIIKKDAEKGGVLKLGTEVVVDQQKTISALLGASPGASTAAPITSNTKNRCSTPSSTARPTESLPSRAPDTAARMP